MSLFVIFYDVCFLIGIVERVGDAMSNANTESSRHSIAHFKCNKLINTSRFSERPHCSGTQVVQLYVSIQWATLEDKHIWTTGSQAPWGVTYKPNKFHCSFVSLTIHLQITEAQYEGFFWWCTDFILQDKKGHVCYVGRF